MNPLGVFLGARYGRGLSRDRITALQANGFNRLRRDVMPKSPFYASFADKPFETWPIMNKARLMSEFTAVNTVGLTAETALNAALEAEKCRGLVPEINGVALGLSTGTSGQRGLFASDRYERALWGALMIGRFMPSFLRRQRVAFFLRSNNQLYESLGNALLEFRFYDLLQPIAALLPRLQRQSPTVLIAPAQILGLLAQARLRGEIDIMPRVVISVAEVLSPEDAALIQRAFHRRVDQVYQCTEGVLAMTCRAGNLHMNESFLHIEREVIDQKTGAFIPVITDLARRTLPIIRYRLDDVLIPDTTPCACGCETLQLARIEGRCDDIVYWAGTDGTPRMIPSDAIRQAVAGVPDAVRDYRAEQFGPDQLVIRLDADNYEAAKTAVAAAIAVQAAIYGAKPPYVHFRDGIAVTADHKRRRVINRPASEFRSSP